MTIKEIAERLNNKAVEENFQIASLPELRKKYLHKKQLSAKIFTWQTIIDGVDKYAFHNGGRDEMQFNIGEEVFEKKACTRIGLCFSLEPSPSLHNPVEDLEPYKRRFNECIKEHPDYFIGFEMWYYKKANRSENYSIRMIPDEWFQYKNFISIGTLIKKPLSELNENDLTKILKDFDKLFPIYDYCVLKNPYKSEKFNENKFTRICFNTEGWVKPSGVKGKSKSDKSYEYQTGFGHEEWLFDFAKVIDGYHYSHLQSIGSVKAHIGKKYNLKLYTINSETKERFWVANIKNVMVLDAKEKEYVYEEYKKRKWFAQMKKDLLDINIGERFFKGKKIDLDTEIGINSFNIKFKQEDTTPLMSPFSKADFDDVKADYYTLYDCKNLESDGRVKKETFNDITPGVPPDKPPISKVRFPKLEMIEYGHIHFEVAKSLYNFLCKEHKKENVYWEYTLPYGARVDIAVKSIKGWLYYEVKSYLDLRTSLRDALGQLLEYKHWKGKNKVDELIIVTQKVIGVENAKNYLTQLREKYGLKIYYRWIDTETNELSEKY